MLMITLSIYFNNILILIGGKIISNKIKKVLIVGYGIITKGILNNLKETQFSITILSKHKSKIQNLKVINELKNIQETYDYIITCFSNENVAQEFWYSPYISSIIKKDITICIEMSTLNMKLICDWFTYIQSKGGIPVEAPFTGSRDGANKGTLSIFLYKEDNVYVNDILKMFSLNIYEFSILGNATKFKLLYNCWGAYILYSIKEFNPKKYNFEDDESICSKIICNDGWMALVCSSKLNIINEEDFDNVSFKLKYMIKDIVYAEKFLFKNNDVPIFNMVKNIYKDINNQDNFNKDFSIIGR